jgi:hypothetical protein
VRQCYIKEVRHTEPATAIHYVYDNPVDPGKILVLRDLCATFSGLKSTEEVQFFVEDHEVRHYLGEDAPLDTGGHPHWSGKIAIGERDRPGVYVPDSAANDEIHLYIFGELWDLQDWIQGGQ